MSKKLPDLTNDAEAEDILDQDLTDYIDLENFTAVRFEFLPKTEKINLRVSRPLLEAVKAKAEAEGMSYQKYIRLVVERSLTS
ncbi:MAG: hypothetical protein KDE56_02205 [Anaerolineales bacterium]|nr:hypothetical protein [Anaerolineales bacterium]